jgi:hypothetical protein
MFVTARNMSYGRWAEPSFIKYLDLPVTEVLCSQGEAHPHSQHLRAASGQGDERAPVRMFNFLGMRSSPCFAR